MRRAFLGTGLIGAGLAEAACGRGDAVSVFNRTREKAAALAAHGARVADSAEDAVRDAERVHLALTSDAAVDSVLASVLPALPAAAVIVDHSTTSPAGAAARAERLAGRAVRFLHVPVFMNPAACRAAKGVMLVSGPRALFEQLQPELQQMTGRVLFAGEDPRAAATLKLVGNGMILSLLGGLSDVFAVASNNGIAAPQALALFRDFDLNNVLFGRGERMAEGDFEVHWTLAMARKDLGLMLEAAGDAPLAALPGVGSRMDQLIEAGEAERDVGVLARDSLG